MTENPAVPVCYRHPRKETYVTCTRCGKSICPDCMNQASVGFQCPDCVKEGRRTQRQPRTAFGGTGGGSGIVTKTLIGTNVAIFVIGLALAGGNAIGGLLQGGDTLLHVYGALVPMPVNWPLPDGGATAVMGVAGGEYWRVLTSMFLHYGIIHLGFNMYVLWVLGRYLERDLGPVRFLSLYLISGLGGSVLTYWLAAPNVASAGASGCIFGLFGAAIFINRRMGRDNSGIFVLLGLNLVLTFMVPQISWTGHVGGLVAGLALGAALAHAPRQYRTMAHAGAFVGALILFGVLIVLRTGQILASVGGGVPT